MRRYMLWRLAVAAILPIPASLPAAGQGSAVYDYPGGYAGRFDDTEAKAGAGANKTASDGGASSVSSGKGAKARKAGRARFLAPATKRQRSYWHEPTFQGGTKVGTQAGKNKRRLQAK